MSSIRLIIRLALLGLHMLLGAFLCLTSLPHRNDAALSARQWRIIQWWLASCGRLAGLRVHTVGQTSIQHGCYVANHISWLDIVVIGSLHPVRFLSKAEVDRWPLIGYLARCAGTIFIQRGNGARAAFEAIKTHLQCNESIALFPEGTAGYSYEIRRFHPRLFGAMIDADVKAQPIAIGYPLDAGHNDNVPFHEDQSFLANVVQVLKQHHVDVVVRYTRAFSTDDRKVFAKNAHALIVREAKAIYAS